MVFSAAVVGFEAAVILLAMRSYFKTFTSLFSIM
jgi:hypothetical protein